MRNAILCLLAFAAAGLAQDNAASNALQQRLENLKLFGQNAPKQIRLAETTPPKVCAIPLLNANPPGTLDKMQVQKPAAPLTRDNVKIPAPPCDDRQFQNR